MDWEMPISFLLTTMYSLVSTLSLVWCLTELKGLNQTGVKGSVKEEMKQGSRDKTSIRYTPLKGLRIQWNHS